MMGETAAESGKTMPALQARAGAGIEGLTVEYVPMPVPGVGDALVRVHAASFTPTELSWEPTWVDRAGHPRERPIPAHEFAGDVAALGDGATGVEIGEAVYALTDWYRDGAAAEFIAVEARDLAPKPVSLDYVHAAAVPLAGLTAWQALFDHGHLTASQTVLIHGAGGGVGTYTVQLARHAGAHVVATARAWAASLTRELGADEFIDVDRQRFEDVVSQVDLVVDLVGGEFLTRSWPVLKPGGTLVSIVAHPSLAEAEQRHVRAIYFIVVPDRGQLRELGRLIDAGELRSIVGEVFPLARGRDAFAAKHQPGVPGKVVLSVTE